jgi:DNA-3-methyladenine glycosylase II
MARNLARLNGDPWIDAVKHLRRIDDVWSLLIERVGPCSLRPRPRKEWFGTLVRAIVGQQISSKAATAIDQRLQALSGAPYVPTKLLVLSEAELRGAGLSRVKAQYIRNLSNAVESGDVPIERFHRWDDESIIESLTSIKGIGVWTAEMFLIFALNRPDVLPVADLGVRAAIRDQFGLSALPRPQECHELTESWRPFRSVASWYLWRGKHLAEAATRS